VFARAQEDLAQAQQAFDSASYEQSIALSQKVLQELEGVKTATRK
jgi:hypothetical protein